MPITHGVARRARWPHTPGPLRQRMVLATFVLTVASGIVNSAGAQAPVQAHRSFEAGPSSRRIDPAVAPVPAPPPRLSGTTLSFTPFLSTMRLDPLSGGGWHPLIGIEAGVNFGRFFGVSAHYFDRLGSSGSESATDLRGWGGSMLFNLNAGRGFTPYLGGGAGQLRVTRAGQVGASNRLAFIAQGGLSFPIDQRVVVDASIKDYIVEIPESGAIGASRAVTHNWMLSGGVQFFVGGRPREEGPATGIEAMADAATDGGTRFTIEPFVGSLRLDADLGGEWRETVGARASVELGRFVGLGAYYWNGYDRSEGSFAEIRGYGAEVQVNLNSGAGVNPFVTVGGGRLELDTDLTAAERLSVSAGAGVVVPINRTWQIKAGVRDYIFDAGEVFREGGAGPRHNLQITAGVRLAFGGRRQAPPVAVAPVPVIAVDRGSDSAAVDSLAVTQGVSVPSAPVNYQSSRVIEVPIPLQGEITLRYGPDQAPQVVTPPSVTVTTSPTAAPTTTPVGAAVTPADLEQLEDRLLSRLSELMSQRTEAEMRRLGGEIRADFEASLEVLRREIQLLREEMDRRQIGAIGQTSRPGGRAAVETAVLAAGAGLRLRAVTPDLADEIHVIAPHLQTLSSVRIEDDALVLELGSGAFESGAAAPTAAARRDLARVGRLIAKRPDHLVLIGGYTDASGDAAKNRTLSGHRADAVARELTAMGVWPEAMRPAGFGSEHPVADNASPEGRALNRRVEIIVIGVYVVQ